MPQNFKRMYQALDYEELVRLYPPPPECFETIYFLDPEQIERIQLLRLQHEVRRGYAIPFHRDRWDEAKFHPSMIKTLADINLIPHFDIDDIRASIARKPPYGDYQGVSVDDWRHGPIKLYWSGGTTGKPRPTLYTQWDREVAAITVARSYALQGLEPGDRVLNAWAFSTHSGAFGIDEGLRHWLNCTTLTTSTGNVTPTRMQVELAVDYQVDSIVTTPDYLLHMASVAAEMGIDPKTDFGLRVLPTPGQNPKVSETFGVPTYDAYGMHEVQFIAAECPARGGLHIWEDCFIVQIVDTDSGELVPDGTEGNIVYTCLYKTGSAQIRFNTLDRSTLYPRSQCECGSWLRKMDYFAGRSDTMVKLRGLNIWPEEIGKLVAQDDRVEDDYFVRAVRRGDRDDLVLMVATAAPPDRYDEIGTDLAQQVKTRFEVKVDLELVRPGELDDLTGKGVVGKLKRFRDERKD